MPKKVNKDNKPGLQNHNEVKDENPAPRGFSLLNYRVQAAILILIGFVFYCNTFSHEAAFDDRMAITDNEYVQQGVAGIPDILTKDAYQSYLEHKNGSNQLAGGRYRPLSLITFAIEQQLMGVDHGNETTNDKEVRIAKEMSIRHIINVWLYILSLIVLLYFLRTVVFPGQPLIAFLATLIFAIHPIHTEVVANVKSRDEILSVLFISLTFIKSFRYKETKKTGDLAMALLCFFLALHSKEYAATLIVLLPLAFYLFGKEPVSASVKATLLYLIPFALYLVLRLNAISAPAEGAENDVMNNPYLYATGMQRIATEIMILLNYLQLLIFPNVLSADYSYNQIPYTHFANPIVWLSLAVHLGLVAVMVLLFKKRHFLCFAIAFYLTNLLLVSNILFNIGAPMGERLIYHSSIGFTVAVAWLLYKGFGKLNIATISKYGLAGFMVILIVVSGFKTIERNKDWKNDATLFLTDVKKVPNSVLVNNNAAAACMNYAKQNIKDIPVRNEWFVKAIKYYDKAIAIYPKHILAHLNRGLCFFNMGMPERALPDWDTVRKYEPGHENIEKYLSIAGNYFFNQGMIYNKENKIDAAIIQFSKSVEANPKLPGPWYELGNAYYAAGKYDEADLALKKALQIAPDYPDAKKLYDRLKATNGVK